MSRSSPGTLQKLELILRRDLKLGPDAAIPPDMPFSGGDVDLDSLDILLLVTSIEKEFGVKISSEAVGKEIFTNVTTLTAYIDEELSAKPAGDAASASTATTPADLLSQLPHRDPFRFVTAVTNVRAGESAEGTWSVTGAEAFFVGHFPGNPLVPGVLIAEALAQISGLASPAGGAGEMLAHADVRFLKPVAPPAQIALRARLTRTIGSLQQFDVAASVAGEDVASGSITLHHGEAKS
jgi:3-hydroxyacyl-[acyl-carrier-protein] dehydratase